ncbi:MAG: hypothetical protein LBR80_10650 [Deltaproteobacteria bacterium]|nr:hypothetical protein [Deltaproteobacteria bacterium]
MKVPGYSPNSLEPGLHATAYSIQVNMSALEVATLCAELCTVPRNGHYFRDARPAGRPGARDLAH